MCKNLKPTSKRVFIDIGASMKRESNPLVKFLKEFKKFGFYFDHIYAFEIMLVGHNLTPVSKIVYNFIFY